MSATSESLLVQIQKLEQNAKLLEEGGSDATQIREEIKLLYKKFNSANSALNEGKSVLKG